MGRRYKGSGIFFKKKGDVLTSSSVRGPSGRGWMSIKTEGLQQCVFFLTFQTILSWQDQPSSGLKGFFNCKWNCNII